MADFGGNDLESFRAEARAWIAANFPPSLKGQPGPYQREDRTALTPDDLAWRKAMGEKGWGAPTWPKDYGGPGLSSEHARVLQEELERAEAHNPLRGMGLMMLGPTLLEYGTEAQKKQHLPRIVRGEVQWCQGFSEPGAGSDLASLSTRAEDKGDHFLVNGQKVWTSGAHYADWCFCLVRTDTTKKQDGISFVLIDMKTPGIEVRRIKLISGSSPFCETFFTDVKVPKDQLVGPLNAGWAIAKRLLQYERSNLAAAGGSSMHKDHGPPAQVAKDYAGEDQAGRIADSDLRARILENDMAGRIFQQTVLRAAAEAKSNAGPSATASIMKNASTRVAQDRAELTADAMGSQGLGWGGEGFSAEELAAVRGWLVTRATTIYGGSQEIQNNIIAKRILGLPDPAPAKE